MDVDPLTETYFRLIYNEEEEGQNDYLLFDFKVVYSRIPRIDSEDYSNLEWQTVSLTRQFGKEMLFGGDKIHIEGVVCHILNSIDVPCYDDIICRLTNEIWKLKECDAISPLRDVEKIEIVINIFVDSFPGGVRFAVAPASDEAVETHLETVVVQTEGYCVICMDKICVGSDVEAVRMPCLHEFHRSCGEEWLRNSGVCPICCYVLPS